MACSFFLSHVRSKVIQWTSMSATVLCRHGHFSPLFIIKRRDDHILVQWWWSWRIWISYLWSKSFQVIQGHMCCIVTSWSSKIERYICSHCVHLVKTHRLRCILTLVGHYLTLRSRGLRSHKLKIWHRPFEVNKCMFWCVSTREARWYLNHCSIILRSKVIHGKPYDCLRSLTWSKRPTVGLKPYKFIPSASFRQGQHVLFPRSSSSLSGRTTWSNRPPHYPTR